MLGTHRILDRGRPGASAKREGVLAGCNIHRGRLVGTYAAGTITLEEEASDTTNASIKIGRTDPEQGAYEPWAATYYDQELDDSYPGIESHPGGTAGVTGLGTLQMQGTPAAADMSALDFEEVWVVADA